MRKRWFIGGIALLVALGAVYTGYWFWLARTFEQNLALWVDQQRAMGYRITYAAGRPGGYPLSIDIDLSQVAIDSPPGQLPWRLSTASKSLSIAPSAPLSLRLLDRGESVSSSVQWVAGGRDYAMAIVGMDLTIRLSSEGELPAIRISGRSIGVS